MKRLGFLLLTLFLLTVTSAFAAGLGVASDDIESFSSPVSIPEPDSKLYYLRSRLNDASGLTPPGVLSTSPELDSGKTHSKRIDTGGSLSYSAGNLAPYGPTIDTYHFWDTVPMEANLRVVSPTAELLITETGNGSTSRISAGLLECMPPVGTAPPSCEVMGASTTSVADSGGAVSNITTVTFANFDRIIETGNWIRLVVYSVDGSFNIQWGYKLNRPASLEVTIP